MTRPRSDEPPAGSGSTGHRSSRSASRRAEPSTRSRRIGGSGPSTRPTKVSTPSCTSFASASTSTPAIARSPSSSATRTVTWRRTGTWLPRESGDEFEEDVKPPFISVYSYSTSVDVDADAEISRVRDVLDIFPALADQLDIGDDGALAVVPRSVPTSWCWSAHRCCSGSTTSMPSARMVIWHDDDDLHHAAGLRRVQLQVRRRRRGPSRHRRS